MIDKCMLQLIDSLRNRWPVASLNHPKIKHPMMQYLRGAGAFESIDWVK
jgi:hypothetical protein